ncbi:MAG: response regulator transcription factor [Burkholderiales bacterium]|nr:response regulator transcription factor [Burkholderiales bacterium]
MRVLLVEDDPVMQRELARTVNAIDGGLVVMSCDSAQPAIDWLDQHPQEWDLAVVDMFLKEGHGFDVLRQCRKTLPHQRAVMLSNYAPDEVAGYARAAGADIFFDKSFDLDRFVEFCKALSADIARSRRMAN